MRTTFLVLVLTVVVAATASAQYFQHVYYSFPKNEDEWFTDGLRDTNRVDTIPVDSALFYAATGIYKHRETALIRTDRIRYVTTDEWGHPIANLNYKVLGPDSSSLFDAYGNHLVETADGYIIVGKVSSSSGDSVTLPGGSDILIMRVLYDGTVVYIRSLDMGQAEEGYSIEKLTGTGDYIGCGYSRKTSGVCEAVVFRMNVNGNIVWAKKYNFYNPVEDHESVARSLVVANSNKIYLTGYTQRLTTNSHTDVLVFGVDGNGNLQERYKLGETGYSEYGNSIIRTYVTGQYLIVGSVVKVGARDNDGLVLYTQPATMTVPVYKHIRSYDAFPSSFTNLELRDVKEKNTSGVYTYFTSGVVSKAANGSDDALVFELHSNLNPKAEYHYGESRADFSNSIELVEGTTGDGFVLFGGYGDLQVNNYFSYLVKANFNGVSPCNWDKEDSLKVVKFPLVTEIDSFVFEPDTIIDLYAVRFEEADSVICEDTLVNDSLEERVVMITQGKIYPNPVGAGNLVYLGADTEKSIPGKVEIYTMDGRPVWTERIYTAGNSYPVSFTLPAWIVPGIYVVRYYTTGTAMFSGEIYKLVVE